MRARAAASELIHDLRDGVEHRLAAIAIDQLEEPALAGFHGSDLRAQVAHGRGSGCARSCG